MPYELVSDEDKAAKSLDVFKAALDAAYPRSIKGDVKYTVEEVLAGEKRAEGKVRRQTRTRQFAPLLFEVPL